MFGAVFIVIGGIVMIIAKAQNDVGSGTMVAGALATGAIPLITVVLCFIGQIPTPPIIELTYGETFGNLVFAISYLCIIAIITSLTSVVYTFIPSADYN